MERLVVSTVVYATSEDVYEFLADFPRYARYSKYLESVDRIGGEPEGPRYALRFSWWKLSYTARSEVTGTDPPERIEFRLLGDFDAGGRWLVEELDEVPAGAPVTATAACRVTFEVEFDASTAHRGMFDLPRFVSLDVVIRKAKPLVETEARRVVERAVADLEGREREVELEVRSETIDPDEEKG